jgi:hypothetical protein
MQQREVIRYLSMPYVKKSICWHWIENNRRHHLNHGRNRCNSKRLFTSYATLNNWNHSISSNSTCDCCRRVLSTRQSFTRNTNTTSGRSDDNDFVWLNICWSYDDVKNNPPDGPVDPDISEYKYIKAKCTVLDIQDKALEIFDSIDSLQYYDDKRGWYLLSEMTNDTLQLYKGGMKRLHLRLPEYYEKLEIGDVNDDIMDNDYGEDDFDSNRDIGREKFNQIFFGKSDITKLRKLLKKVSNKSFARLNSPERSLERVIRFLVNKLQITGYARSNIKMFTVVRNSDEISTKQWVLLESMRHSNTSLLRSALLGNAGALNHIVQCLHYDFLWKNVK